MMRRAGRHLVLGVALLMACAHTPPVARPGDLVRVRISETEQIVGRATLVEPDRLEVQPADDTTPRTIDRGIAMSVEIDRLTRRPWHRPISCGFMIGIPLIAATGSTTGTKDLAVGAAMTIVLGRECFRAHHWIPAAFPGRRPATGTP